MSNSSITFEDEIVMKLYQSILHEHRGLSKIIAKLVIEYGGIKVESIKNNEKGVEIVLIGNDEAIYIDLDYLKKKIYLGKKNMPYKEVYDDLPTKSVNPIGHLYQNNEREIYKRLTIKLSPDNSVKYYELNENGDHYTIILDVNKNMFSEKEFLDKVLYNSSYYNGIRDLFIFINENVDKSDVDIKLSDSKGSNIAIINGKVKEYLEYIEENDQYIKIYLENGEFYYERRIKETYQDNMTAYIKKIGERNGKEKR